MDWRTAEFDDRWIGRNQVIASFIHDGERVMDFGAGNCNLARLLPDSLYIPFDLTRRYGAVPMDLNGELPQLHLRHGPNVAVFSGVLEYLDDPPRVLSWAASWADAIILTYDFGAGREKNGFVNDYGWDELLDLVPMEVEGYKLWKWQAVIRFSRRWFAYSGELDDVLRELGIEIREWE